MTDEQIESFVMSSAKKWDRLPPGPHDFIFSDVQGFLIWPTWKVDEPLFVLSQLSALKVMQESILEINQRGEIVTKGNNGVCPSDLEEFAPEFTNRLDPFGGEWIWNPETCEASVTSIPELMDLELPYTH